jgi:stearoyl-CoA desaturase (delta-9 desaturase)
MWQHKYLLPLQLLLGYMLPISIAHYCWNDIRGGLIYASILRIFLAHQANFFVNSLAHYIGDKPFDDRHTPCDSLITALFTFGEGYHNFHHTFPNDFRNAIEWWQYDPCKWLIAGWKSAGLAWDLKSFQYGEIEKRRVQQARKMLDKRAGVLDWGVPIGGKFFVKSAVGKDATAMFNGGVYSHSLTATNLLATMRVAVINGGGGEVEALKE